MLIHCFFRVAAYFGLDHNVDQSGNCVIVNKTKNTRLPDMRFKDHIIEDAVSETQIPMKLKLMKRESCSCESGDRSDLNEIPTGDVNTIFGNRIISFPTFRLIFMKMLVNFNGILFFPMTG